MNPDAFRKMALSFPGAEEHPHFERASFKVKNKIFATLAEDTCLATFKFSLSDQSLFCSFDKTSVYPVPNKWGEQGWTNIELKKVPDELILDALNTAYTTVLKKKLKSK
jgi:predicted DNA-binding protein (MmcQ/YjbR family)